MSNLTGLRDGRTFCANPELEADPGKARAAKKMFLVSLNAADLLTDKCWTVDALRSLCVGLIPSRVGGRKATKADMIKGLTEYIKEERDILVIAANQAMETLGEVGFDSESVISLIIRLSGQDLADALVQSMVSKGHATVTILKTVKPRIIKQINEFYKGTDKALVVAGVHAAFKAESAENSLNYKLSVNSKLETKTALTPLPLLEWVKTIVANPYNSGWKECSVALALVTGRRMAEVHGVGTLFELDPENKDKLIFTGQLKTRGRTDVSPRSIPLLIPPCDVLKLYKALELHGKTKLTPTEVNKKFAHPLNDQLPLAIRSLFETVGIKSYHDLRGFYAACVGALCEDNTDSTRYVGLTLGHGEFDTRTGGSYRKFYLTDNTAFALLKEWRVGPV